MEYTFMPRRLGSAQERKMRKSKDTYKIHRIS